MSIPYVRISLLCTASWLPSTAPSVLFAVYKVELLCHVSLVCYWLQYPPIQSPCPDLLSHLWAEDPSSLHSPWCEPQPSTFGLSLGTPPVHHPSLSKTSPPLGTRPHLILNPASFGNASLHLRNAPCTSDMEPMPQTWSVGPHTALLWPPVMTRGNQL